MVRVAVIGVGAVGLCWARAGVELGLAELSLADPFPSHTSREWARCRQLEIHGDAGAAVHGADVILVCVPGHLLPSAAAAVVAAARSGAVVVDLSTAAAAAKQDASAAAAAAGVGYADAAITGAVALSGVRTPLLYAGDRFSVTDQLFEALGTPVTYLVDSRPGDAVRVKLLRSVIMKGLEALAVDALPAARRYGLLEQLLAVLGDVDQRSFADLLRSMVVTHPVQAARRQAEVVEAAAQLGEVGSSTALTEEVARRFGHSADQMRSAGTPEAATLESTLDWLDANVEADRVLVAEGVRA